MFNYELEICLDSHAELPPVNLKEGEWYGDDEYRYNDRYYGFLVKDIGFTINFGKNPTDRVFTMIGKSSLEDLQKQFANLTKEVLVSVAPPKYFKKGIELLNTILIKLKDQDFEENMEWEVSRHYPMFGIRLNLDKIPAPVTNSPKPDGYVAGSVWEVSVLLKDLEDGHVFPVTKQAPVFCIKPESAVHEVFDRIFRNYSGLLERYEIYGPAEVRKVHNNIKIPYIVVDEKEKEE